MFDRFTAPLAALAAGVLLSGLAPAVAAPSDAPKSIGKFGGWEAFVEDGKGGKVCYAASLPARSKNEPKGRGRAYAMISDHPADKAFGTLGITSGFAFKKGSPAMLDVNGTKFDLYTVGETAWTRDDKTVVAVLAKGRSATFVGYPVKGDPVADLYALAGFGDARAAIDKACGAK